jgi:hypothetical protein
MPPATPLACLRPLTLRRGTHPLPRTESRLHSGEWLPSCGKTYSLPSSGTVLKC